MYAEATPAGGSETLPPPPVLAPQIRKRASSIENLGAGKAPPPKLVWRRSVEGVWEEAAATDGEVANAAAAVAETQAAAAQEEAASLAADGWVAYTDDLGREYYYNEGTNQTVWEKPDTAPAPLPPSAAPAIPGTAPKAPGYVPASTRSSYTVAGESSRRKSGATPPRAPKVPGMVELSHRPSAEDGVTAGWAVRRY